MRIAGFDPSFRNWGISYGWLNVKTLEYSVDGSHLIQTQGASDKKVKKNTADTDSAFHLQRGTLDIVKEQAIKMVFAELPDSGQSYRAGVAHGCVLGAIARLRMESIPVVYVSPRQVKMAATNKINATKKEMIAWARKRHPDAGWLLHTRNGARHKKGDYDDARNEHLADSMAAIEAGIQDPEFISILEILRTQSA